MPKLKIEAIKPTGMIPTEVYERAMKQAVYKAAGLILKDLESTVRTWDKKPTFDLTITEQGGNYSVAAGTDNEIYGYVDEGTKPHEIKPKRSKYLRFSSGYKAKTRVGIIGSVQGGPSGDDVFSKGVMHPGFPGREFTKRIAQRRQTTVQQEVGQAIAKVAQGGKVT